MIRFPLLILGLLLWMGIGFVADFIRTHNTDTTVRMFKMPAWLYLILTILSLLMWPSERLSDHVLNTIMDYFDK